MGFGDIALYDISAICDESREISLILRVTDLEVKNSSILSQLFRQSASLAVMRGHVP